MSVEKVAIGGVCVGGTCAAGYGVYEFSRAKDLRGLLFQDEPLIGDEEDSVWSGLADKYGATGATNTFNGFTLQDVSGGKTKANQLKEKCLEALKTPVSNESEITALKEPTRSWCTKKSSNFTPAPTAVAEPSVAAAAAA